MTVPKGFLLLAVALFLRVPLNAQEIERFPRLTLPGEQPRIPAPDFPDVIVSLDLRDMDILEALKFIAEKGQLNIIPTKDVSGKVSLTVENVSLKDVFDIVLRSNKLAYEKKGNIFNVMTETEYKAMNGRNFFDSRLTKVFRLRYAIPDQAFALLNTMKSDIGKVLIDQESGILLVVDAPERISEMENALDALEQRAVVKVFNLKYARAKDIEEQLKAQLDIKKVGSIKADERTNQVVVQTLAERMEDIQKLIEGLDQKTRQILLDARIIQVKLKNEGSSSVEWEGLFDISKGESLTYVGSYPFSQVGPSSVASSNDWISRKALFEQQDYVGSFPFTGTTTNFAAGTQSIGAEEMHLGVIGKHDFDVVLKYLRTLGETKILSNPKLAVINNQEAKIHVGERQAYITTTTTQTQTSTTVSEAVTYVDVGIQLAVTPTINEEGFVTVKIKPEISSVIDYLLTSSNNRIPIIDTSTAETIVMVREGSSILIGGLSKEDKNETRQETPFLSRIPILGEAFRSKTSKATRSELVILLTPHIVSGDELVTGYGREFTQFLDKDKQYQGYTSVSQKEEDDMQVKTYQDYLSAQGEAVMPAMKPARNF